MRRSRLVDPRHHDGLGDLIVVTGPPGAGKTAVAGALSKLFDHSAVVAGDEFFAMIDQGYIDPWTPAAHRQNQIVVGAAAAAAGRLAAGGYTVVYDGVIGPWFLDAFASGTGLSAIHYVVLLPGEDVCLERVRARTGHGFADLDAARHMYREFARRSPGAQHVLTSLEPPAVLAASISDLVSRGLIVWPVDPTLACPS